MSVITSPPAIIFLNENISAQIQSVFVRQLYITQVLNAATFDGYVAADGYYANNILADGYRVLVLRDFSDFTNRNLANIVLFAKNGLVAVEWKNNGPHSITMGIDRCYLTALMKLNIFPCGPFERRKDIDDEFVGQFDNDNFNPHVLDPVCQRAVEPPDE
jgi:hypothetical protein